MTTIRYTDSKQKWDLVMFLIKLGVLKRMHLLMIDDRPLQVESIEAVLKSVTFDMKDLKLWPNVK